MRLFLVTLCVGLLAVPFFPDQWLNPEGLAYKHHFWGERP